MSRAVPPARCAVCGADIPRDAKACPECGADERTGWHEQSIYDGLDLPEAEFDHQAHREREFGGGPPGKAQARFWWVVAVAMLDRFRTSP